MGHAAFHLTLESTYDTLPRHDETAKLTITADAKLDNRSELCQRFNLRERVSLSDSELILHAWRLWGEDCPKYLIGEFVVVIWDEVRKALYCFTDQTGQRTFFYYYDSNLFAFASDLNALHTVPGIERKPNLSRIANHGNISYIINNPESTCYESIFKATASTFMTVKEKKLEKRTYWKPNIHHRINFSSEEEYIEAFQELFESIVRSKMRSHSPIVTLLSGGLDSSSITAMTSNILNQEGKSVTALSAMLPKDYKGVSTDERYYINLLQKPNLHIQAITDWWRGPFDGLEREDFYKNWADKSSRFYLYTAFATAATKLGARIILDGCYGEKGPSFHGNGYFAELFLKLRWRTLFREGGLYMKRYNRPFVKFALMDTMYPLLPAKIQEKLKLRSDLAFSKELSFIKPSFIDKNLKTLEIKNLASLNTQFPNHRLHQYQAMSYQHAHNFSIPSDSNQPVQFSFPYNDKRMLEFCLAIPGDLKVRNGYKRYSIRSGMRGLMPDELRFRTTKEPFSPDYNDRYNRQLGKAKSFVLNFSKIPLVNEIIDLPKLTEELNHQMETNRCSTARDFTSMHTVPRALYLMAFLSTFS